MTLNLRTKPGNSNSIGIGNGIGIGNTSSVPADFPSPADIGMPDKFSRWRPGQVEAFTAILQSERRFVGICAPTGFGKSPVEVAAPMLSGLRTAILTSTLGLQDQLHTDFVSVSSDIRGQANYTCPIANKFNLPPTLTVSDAPCQCGYRCALKRSGCDYYDKYAEAQRAQIFVTNYQCWMHDANKLGATNGDLQFGFVPARLAEKKAAALRESQRVRILVIDECHASVEELSRFIGVELTRRECLAIKLEWPDAGMNLDGWREWARHWAGNVAGRYTELEDKLKSGGGAAWSREFKHLRDIQRKLDRLAGMKAEDDWIVQESDVQGRSMAMRMPMSMSMSGVKFDVLNPARYAEQALFRGVDKVVLVSATLRPKTAELLGIGREEFDFREYPSSFAPSRRPIIYVPTVQVNYKTEQDDYLMMKWLRRIDSIIGARLDRKGIVHAVSYKRMKFLLDNSEHRALMMTHGTRDRAAVVEEFKRAEPPRVLVSPSVDTGYDFIGSQARYQIIGKIPFASVQDKVIKARQDRDKEYGLYLASQTLIQMAGRIVRSDEDWGETIVVDSNFGWFYYKVRKFLAQWFQEAVQWENTVPKPIWFDDDPVATADAIADVEPDVEPPPILSAADRPLLICEDCGALQSVFQRERDRDCQCGGSFSIPYVPETDIPF